MMLVLALNQVYNSAKSLEALDIKYNIALIPFFNEKEDLPRFPDFVNMIKSCKAEIALHGLYHEKEIEHLMIFIL
jgi:hypothetical protein